MGQPFREGATPMIDFSSVKRGDVVKYVPVFYVNLTILGEPILALLMMYLLRERFAVFRESSLTPLQIVGGLMLLVGVGIGLLSGRKPQLSEASV